MKKIAELSMFAPLAADLKAEKKIFYAALAGALVVHLLAVGLFRVPRIERSAGTKPLFQLRLNPSANETELAMLDDPSLLALPSARGFSRSALVRTIPSPTPQPSRQEHAELLPNLFSDSHTHLLVVEESLQTHLQSRFDRLSPQSQEEPSTVQSLAPVRSICTVSARNVQRKLLSQPSFPILEGSSPPQPTVLRVGVNVMGAVAAALISKPCGNEGADQLAVREASRWRFTALADALEEQLDWFEVTIYWASSMEGSPVPQKKTPTPTPP